MSIFEASERYEKEGVPLVILAGKEYGSGSSRDWAAKGPQLLGVRAVLAESYERIHRSNLVGMGVLPLQFKQGDSIKSLGLSGEETFDIEGLLPLLENNFAGGKEIVVRAHSAGGARQRIASARPHRYASGDPLLQARRHSALCAAAIVGGEIMTSKRIGF